MRIDSPLMTNAVATGSFTGSFTGEFIGDIQADSVAYEDITGKPTLISGSVQIDITQTTGYTSFSSSIAGDIAGLDGEYATDAELNASSSALITAYTNADSTLSSSLATDIATNASDIGTLEGKTLISGSTQVDHDATTNFVANEHVDHSGVTITAGSGLTGGGDITTSRTINVGEGTGITVGANDISTNDSEIVHDNLSGFVANEHIDHSSVTLTAGDGLSGGGDITTNRTFAVDGTVLRTTGDGIVSSSAQIDHDQTTNYDANEHFTQGNITTVGTVTSGDVSAILPNGVISGSDQVTLSSVSGYVANENIDHSTVSITAGSGLTGGGTIAATRTINVGAGTGVTVNADDIAIGQDVATTANVTFGSVSVTNDVTISGDLTVLGDATELQVSALNIEDINITVASGSTTSAQADGAGITIAGANESLTWDHGNSRFNFSDDLNVAGNITVSGTVDGVDILSLSNTVGGIDTSVPAIVDNSGTPAFNTGITKAEVLSILNVEDGATADQTQADINGLAITEVGTISSGTWNGSVIASAYLDADTAHLSGTQTFTGTKTFSNNITVNGIPFGKDLSADTDSIAIGSNALDSTTSGTSNIAIGSSALTAATTGFGNIAIGKGSLQSVTTGTNTVAIGESAANNLTSGFSVAIGWYALNSVQQSSLNTAVGPGALRYIQADGNTAVGYNAGAKDNSNANQTDSSYSVYIGSNTTTGTGTNVTNEIVIGYDAEGNGSNTATFGNSNITANYFTGVVRTTGDVVAYYSSDERLKDNVVEIDGALEKVEALRGVSFDWNDKQDVYEGHDVGVIAQEVEAILPELVQTRDNGYKAVKYEKLTAVLIQAVKELSARVKELENK